MWLSALLSLTMVLTLDSTWNLYIGPLGYGPQRTRRNNVPTSQTTNRVPQNYSNYLELTY